MKLIARVKLNTTDFQRNALLDSLYRANECCNWLSTLAWARKTFRQFGIHAIGYYGAREKFPSLASQTVIRCIAKVADAYKLERSRACKFRLNGSIPYDDKNVRWYPGSVSIWTTSGRLRIPFTTGPKQAELLKSRQGESDLIYHKGEFYLAAACNVIEATPEQVSEFLGVDLGVVNIATDSDGGNFCGKAVKSVRCRNRRLRSRLQKKRTKSARRRLKALSGREARFARDLNHCISKQIVAKAKGTGRGIALEELSHIRTRITAGRKQRGILHSWSFGQLRAFIEYKAALAGVPVAIVDPRNSSRECAECGFTDKRNRPTRDTFRCVACGHTAPADHNAATNLRKRGRAATEQPNVAGCAEIAHI